MSSSMERSSSSTLVAVFAMLALMWPPEAASGQAVIQGSVIARDSRRPVAGALVVANGPSGQRVPRLSDDGGVFRLEPGEVGRWVILVSQLGYHNEVKTLDLGDQGVIELQFALAVDPVQLPAITAFGDGECPIPDDPERVIQLVEEVRRALASRSRPTLTIRYQRRVQEFGTHHHLYADDPWDRTWAKELALDTISLRTDEPLASISTVQGCANTERQRGLVGARAPKSSYGKRRMSSLSKNQGMGVGRSTRPVSARMGLWARLSMVTTTSCSVMSTFPPTSRRWPKMVLAHARR